MLLLPNSKRAQALTLIIVFVVMAVLAGSAYLLSSGRGSEISGFANYEGGCNGSITLPGNYELTSDLVCTSSNGINISSSNVTLDCLNKVISGDSFTGVIIWNNSAKIGNITVKNCEITGFGTGILIKANPQAIERVNITNNVLNSGGMDIDFSGSPTEVKVWNNNFHGNGVTVSAPASFCIGGIGNFYRSGIAAANIGSGDCGPIHVVNQTGDSLAGQTLFNRSTITFVWNHTPSALSRFYYTEIYDNISGWQEVDPLDPLIPDNFSTFDISTYVSDVTLNFRVTPYDGRKNASSNETGEFTLDNDNDNDGYSWLSPDLEYWDCNESNISIHRPSNRENDTSRDMLGGNGSTFCFNGVDDDCDNTYDNPSIDWLDPGCGHGFSVGSFDASLYTNGSIRNLSKSLLDSGSYYALISNQYGKIEYTTDATNLSGVNLEDVFEISPNSISVEKEAYGGRFNKSATVTFLGLTQYKKVPILLVDGVPCPSDVCVNPAPRLIDAFNNNISFTAPHFSAFTTTSNSRGTSFTQAESEAGFMITPEPIETFQRARFFVNYSRYLSGLPINNLTGGDGDVNNGGDCNITLFYSNHTIIPGTNQ
ncbi:hypothetical protein HZB90_04955, partial [archaeon]|nr:hypothetical protein [archaeon]